MKYFVVLVISLVVLVYSLGGQVQAHVDNAKYLILEWLAQVSGFDYSSDGKVNLVDFTIDTHPGQVHPSPSAAPQPTTGATSWPNLRFTSYVSGLASPLHLTHAGDGSNRLFVVEQTGQIRVIKNNNLSTSPFLSISNKVSCCGERGLLGLAFPPGFAQKQYFYVNYTSTAGHTVVARYRVSTNLDIADLASEQIILTINQPYSNHNGGSLAFGPDGYLYIGMGDGGSGGDPQNHAQNTNDFLGKILRIDVESGSATYAIPPSNPFVGQSGYRGEIWAMGMRNPWKFSFDRVSGDLYIVDVGQNQWEEINFQARQSGGGENYGWRCYEGNHVYNTSGCQPQSAYIAPVAEYDHGLGCSATGGYVYRATEFSRMQGVYFYGDYCSGRVWGMRRVNNLRQSQQLSDTNYMITTFGEDEAGNLYLGDYTGGVIYKVVDLP